MTSRLGLLLILALLLAPCASRADDAGARRARRSVGGAGTMARIPGGTYRPLYAPLGGAQIRVAPFALDRQSVTRGEYLAFVVSHPAWRRDSIRRPLHLPVPVTS